MVHELIDKRHGSAWDRGAADSYYRRGIDPHYYVGGSYTSERIAIGDIRFTTQNYTDYIAGYELNEAEGNHKDYGG